MYTYAHTQTQTPAHKYLHKTQAHATHVHTLHTQTHTNIHANTMHAHTQTQMHTHKHLHKIQTHIQALMHTDTRSQTCTQRHTHRHTHKHTHTCAVPALGSSGSPACRKPKLWPQQSHRSRSETITLGPRSGFANPRPVFERPGIGWGQQGQLGCFLFKAPSSSSLKVDYGSERGSGQWGQPTASLR